MRRDRLLAAPSGATYINPEIPLLSHFTLASTISNHLLCRLIVRIPILCTKHICPTLHKDGSSTHLHHKSLAEHSTEALRPHGIVAIADVRGGVASRELEVVVPRKYPLSLAVMSRRPEICENTSFVVIILQRNQAIALIQTLIALTIPITSPLLSQS